MAPRPGVLTPPLWGGCFLVNPATSMTRVARVVLQDAKHAIAAHSPSLHSEEFRISWFAVVGLLRAVGHVLDKVDSQSSEALGQAIRERWLALQATRPDPQIFW